MLLDIENVGAWTIRRFGHRCHACVEPVARIMAFQRIARRDQPPDPVQLNSLQALFSHQKMTIMHRIERPAIKPDRLASTDRRQANALRRVTRKEAAQGRV